MRKKARRGKEQAYLSGASCWRSSTLLLLRPGAAADLQIASCCCLLQIHTAWLEEKLDPLLCTRRREEEEATVGKGWLAKEKDGREVVKKRERGREVLRG